MVSPQVTSAHLHAMTPAERGLAYLLADRPLWVPLPGPQMDAYLSEADELFYGGAAGGGKTDLMLGLALTAHRSSIIFRREFTQLSGAGGIIERSRELLSGTANYNGTEHMWRSIPGGRKLEFGAVQYDDDVRKYRGRPHDLKCFDELPEFPERVYLFLSGWKRTTIRGQRTRLVSGGNPPTDADGEWVLVRWGAWLDPQHTNPARPGELRWYAVIDGKDTAVEDGKAFAWKGERIKPLSRTFVPARVEDNPFLLETDYVATLQNLPEPLRSQLLHGSFTAGVDDNPWQVIPTAWVQAAQARWEQNPHSSAAVLALGVDVARGGKDETVIAVYRDGGHFDELAVYPGVVTPDGPSAAALVLQHHEGLTPIGVDIVGVGGSVYDSLLLDNVLVLGINNAGSTGETDRTGKLHFANIRAASYWKLREALDPAHGLGLALPNDRQLRADLCAARYRLTSRGIQIEDKDNVKARLGRSPDRGDALVLAFWTAQTGIMLASGNPIFG